MWAICLKTVGREKPMWWAGRSFRVNLEDAQRFVSARNASRARAAILEKKLFSPEAVTLAFVGAKAVQDYEAVADAIEDHEPETARERKTSLDAFVRENGYWRSKEGR